jgi:hypothetical protein
VVFLLFWNLISCDVDELVGNLNMGDNTDDVASAANDVVVQVATYVTFLSLSLSLSLSLTLSLSQILLEFLVLLFGLDA